MVWTPRACVGGKSTERIARHVSLGRTRHRPHGLARVTAYARLEHRVSAGWSSWNARAPFYPIVAVGIAIRLVVLWVGGKIFEDQIRSVLDFIDDYQWWVVGGLFAITLYQTSRRKPIPAPDPEIVDSPVVHSPHTHHDHVAEEIATESEPEVETSRDRDIL